MHSAQIKIGWYGLLMLLLCADVSLNSGLLQTCEMQPERTTICDSDDALSHLKCLPEAICILRTRLTRDYHRLTRTSTSLMVGPYCVSCQPSMFCDSFFSSAESLLADHSDDERTATSEVNCMVYELRSMRKK